MREYWPFFSLLLAMCASAEQCTFSKVYRDVCSSIGDDYWDYEKFTIENMEFLNPEDFEITGRIGGGKFSDVMEAVDMRREGESFVVLKVLKPIHIKKIKREISILQILSGRADIIGFEGICHDTSTEATTLVFEHIGRDTKWLSHLPSSQQQHYRKNETSGRDVSNRVNLELSLSEIKRFMLKLLRSLDYCHSCGIMHRDVKPRNVIVNVRTGVLRLIDWGLADFYLAGRKYAVRVGSRYYKAPELLIGFRYYDYAVDIFSAGCVLAGLLFKTEPFFRGKDNDEQLMKICSVLGSEELRKMMSQYEIKMDSKLDKLIGHRKKKDWLSFVNEDNRHLLTSNGLDLLERMLTYDHQTRITAKDALSHPFFEDSNCLGIKSR